MNLQPALPLPGPDRSPALFSTCEDAIHTLTHLYLELRLPPAFALRAARADCQSGTAAGVPDREVEGDVRAPAAPGTEKPFAPPGLVIAAFAAVYVIWGSTYLAIRIAIGTIPPFLMAGVRFLTAGALLLAVLRVRGVPAPRGVQWRSAAIVGGLLLLAGNGGVTWAELRVPSSLAALLIATVPLWMIVLDSLRPGGSGRPTPAVFGGLAMGFAGVALIVLGKDASGHRAVDGLGVAALLGASFCWAVGSVYSKGLPQASHPLMAVSAQMLCGGGMMTLAALVHGEVAEFDPARVSRASLLALAYLIFIGALVGFTAYVWLLRVSTPARVSTYAYVNPLIAVLLGASLGHEVIHGSTLLAGGLIVVAVILITTSRAAAGPSADHGKPART